MDDEHIITVWKDGERYRFVRHSPTEQADHSTLLSYVDVLSIFGHQFLANLKLIVEWPVRVVVCQPTIYVQAPEDILSSLVKTRELLVNNAQQQV